MQKKKEKPVRVADIRNTAKSLERERDLSPTAVLAETALAEDADADDKQSTLFSTIKV